MMKKRLSILIPLAALAGCAHNEAQPGEGSTAGPEAIRYETSPCFGMCPVYTVTVRRDGSGTFTGMRNTQVKGDRTFTVTPAQYAAFAARLAPYRPEGERLYQPGSPLCENAATDMPGVDVKWTGPKGTDHLNVYYGCDRRKNGAMIDALGNAVDALPIESLIGERP